VSYLEQQRPVDVEQISVIQPPKTKEDKKLIDARRGAVSKKIETDILTIEGDNSSTEKLFIVSDATRKEIQH